MTEAIKPNVGDILRHKKGAYYRVLMYCKHTEDQEILVVYESIKDKTTYARPLTMFTVDRFVIAISAEDLK